jgi:hypothetical protein
VEEVNAVISECLPLVYDTGDIVNVEDQVVVLGDQVGDLCDGHILEGVGVGVGAANAVGDLASDGNHRGGVEKHGDNVGGARPLGDNADPNALHDCATNVGKSIVGTVALQQLDEDVVAFAWVGAAPHPQWGGLTKFGAAAGGSNVAQKGSDTGERGHRSRGCQVHHGGGDRLGSGRFAPL